MNKKIIFSILLTATIITSNSNLNAWVFSQRDWLDPFYTGWGVIGEVLEEGWPISTFRLKSIHEKEGKLIVVVEIPGYQEEEINVTITNKGRLTISAKAAKEEKKEEEEEAKDKKERVYFHRKKLQRQKRETKTTLFLPAYGINPDELNFDPKEMDLEYNNGILTIKIPKKKIKKPEEITLKFKKEEK